MEVNCILETLDEKMRCEICQRNEGAKYDVFSRIRVGEGLITQTRVIYSCRNCEHLTVNGPIADAEYYDSLPSSGQWSKSGKYIKRFAHLRKLLDEGANILDIGCYNGQYLVENFKGCNLFGVEPNRMAAARAESQGITILGKDVYDVHTKYQNKFQGIFLFDVIEHVPDIWQFLSKIEQLAAPNCLLVIETGRADSRMAKVMGKNWYYVRQYQHARSFSNKSMLLLLEKNCFQVRSISTVSHSMPRMFFSPIYGLFLWTCNLLGLDRQLRGALGAPFLPIRDHMYVIANKLMG
jgi:SAM-dependent methyltransferase